MRDIAMASDSQDIVPLSELVVRSQSNDTSARVLEPSTPEHDLDKAFAKLQRVMKGKSKFMHKRKQIQDESQAVITEIMQLEEKRSDLRNSALVHAGQYEEWLDSVSESTIIPYAKAWNLSFAEKLQARLPRELRDMIYRWMCADGGHLNTFFTDFVGMEQPTDALPGQTPCDCGYGVPLESDLEHFLLPAYVGLPMVQEFVEVLYKEYECQVIAKSPETIKHIMAHDVFHVGVNPLHLLRSMIVECLVDDYRTPKPLWHQQTEDCEHTSAERMYLEQGKLKACFNVLLALPRKAGFDLDVNFYQRNVRIAVIEEALECFRDIHKVFTEAGARVTIMWLYPSAGSELGLWISLVDFYELPRDKWRAKMREEIDKVHDGLPRGIRAKHIRWLDEPTEDMSDREFAHRMWELSEQPENQSSRSLKHEPGYYTSSESELDTDPESSVDYDEWSDSDPDL